jgi:hypothetical protein
MDQSADLLLNRGFSNTRAIQDPITCELPFIMSAIKREKAQTPGSPPKPVCWRQKVQPRTSYNLESARERHGEVYHGSGLPQHAGPKGVSRISPMTAGAYIVPVASLP